MMDFANLWFYFYSRPHGRGDAGPPGIPQSPAAFLLAPPREGRLGASTEVGNVAGFLLAPPREGRRTSEERGGELHNFYSRPHGRGDGKKG